MTSLASVMHYIDDGLTVAELIERLKDMPQEAKVAFKYNYGDYWRTTVAERVQTVDECDLFWSEYHSMPKVVEDDGDEENKGITVVLLG